MSSNVAWFKQISLTSAPLDGRTFSASLGDQPVPNLTHCSVDPGPEHSVEEDELERIALTPETLEAWIEAQLLDCYNLARQHGLSKTVSILDSALDQLGQVETRVRSVSEGSKNSRVDLP